MDMDLPSGDIGDLGRSDVEVMAERDADAIEMLTQDHRMIEELFKRYEELDPGDDDERASVVGEISEGLSAHAAIEELVFAMKPGEVRGPVRADRGFHVIKLVDRKTKDPKPLDEVKDDIRMLRHEARP